MSASYDAFNIIDALMLAYSGWFLFKFKRAPSVIKTEFSGHGWAGAFGYLKLMVLVFTAFALFRSGFETLLKLIPDNWIAIHSDYSSEYLDEGGPVTVKALISAILSVLLLHTIKDIFLEYGEKSPPTPKDHRSGEGPGH